MRVTLAQLVSHQRCLDVASQPETVLSNGRQPRKKNTVRSKTVRLSRSNARSRPQAPQDVTEYTRQQGTTVPPARAQVTLKRETACTTRKAEPSGRTVSKVCHVCLLSLPHHREPSTESEDCMELLAQCNGSFKHRSQVPLRLPDLLVRILVSLFASAHSCASPA